MEIRVIFSTLDENLPQTSNIFRNVVSGTHEMSISDAYGCGSTIL
jgi:hypothetical protein